MSPCASAKCRSTKGLHRRGQVIDWSVDPIGWLAGRVAASALLPLRCFPPLLSSIREAAPFPLSLTHTTAGGWPIPMQSNRPKSRCESTGFWDLGCSWPPCERNRWGGVRPRATKSPAFALIEEPPEASIASDDDVRCHPFERFNQPPTHPLLGSSKPK